MTSSTFFKFHKISIHRKLLPSFSIIWLESEKKICLFDRDFSQALPLLISYHGNTEWPILKLFTLKDDIYNDLKSHKVWWRSAKLFLRYFVKTLKGPFNPISAGLFLAFYDKGWGWILSPLGNNITVKQGQRNLTHTCTCLKIVPVPNLGDIA